MEGLYGIKAICGRHSALKGKVHGGSKQAAFTSDTLEPKTINDSLSTNGTSYSKQETQATTISIANIVY